jgi:hypothetical protein
MKISDFIQEVLIDKFKEIQQDEENHYISFGLIYPHPSIFPPPSVVGLLRNPELAAHFTHRAPLA